MTRPIPFALLALLLAGCAGSPSRAPVPHPAPSQVAKQMKEAAVSPLNDLNLLKTEIPAVLLAARKGPYRPPADAGCDAIKAEVQQLDEALGADVDAQKDGEDKDPNLLERGVVAAENMAVGTAVGMVQSTTDVIPFRPWVRKLTGAERASKEVSAAISAGTRRRAFLKGMAVGTGCTPPAPAAATAADSKAGSEPEATKSFKRNAWPEGLE